MANLSNLFYKPNKNKDMTPMNLATMRQKPKFAQEIWDMINQNTPSLNAIWASKCLNYKLESSVKKHDTIWNAIFC